MPHALLVEPEQTLLGEFEEMFEAEGFEIHATSTLAEARSTISEVWPDIALIDVDLPDGDGIELLHDLQDGLRPEAILLIDEARTDEALEAMRHGAGDFLSKPYNPKRLRSILTHVARTRSLLEELDQLRGQLRRLGRFGRFVGSSPPILNVYDLIARVAPTEATVLIAGESGTGKEIVARTLHDLSPRRHEPFCPVNCGAIASELLESTLFGHEEGAFTGADKRHRGWFERAHGGTLFLDEVTEMPLESQVNLLRVLETGKVVRVGGEEPIDVDARVIAATNRPVEEAVEQGELREDLYYRLKVFPIWLPPLRDRGHDVELLAQYFLEEFNESLGGDAKQFTSEALERLSAYDWPGNVRELKNAVRSAFILADEKIGPDSLPLEVAGATPGAVGNGSTLRVRIGTSIAEVERRLILATLEHCDNNKTRAAEVLGISVKTLYNRLAEYGYDAA